MISIVVPSRNRRVNLLNTVDALVNQSVDKDQYEIIISDDNSDDGSFEVYTQYKDSRRLKYVNNNTKPHSWNASIVRNLGAMVADPDTKAYIFVDSDVVLPRTAIETYLADLSEGLKGYTYLED